MASAIAASGQPRPEGRLNGPNIVAFAGVVDHVMVALPEVVDEFSVIVAGAVKLASGAPKLLHDGGYTAPEGDAVTAALRTTVPLNPFASDTVMRHVPDDPCATEIEAPQGVMFIPGRPTATLIAGEAGLAE